MKCIITIAMLISALFSANKEKNTSLFQMEIYTQATRCINIEQIKNEKEKVTIQNCNGFKLTFDTDAGDYNVGDDITVLVYNMGTPENPEDDIVLSARYDRYDLLP